jgi:hypothetical protein
MKYMLLIYGDEAAAAHATPEQGQAISDEYDVFTKSITDTGQFLDGDPFLPTSTATTVSAPNGSIESSTGPAVTSSPQLMAYYKVEADGPEQAIEMAKRVPHAKYGSVEVREVVVYD